MEKPNPLRIFMYNKKINMTKTVDNYKAFEGLNLSGKRSEDENYEQYRSRLRQNKKIMKMYSTMGIEGFREIFPNGVHEALENSAKEVLSELKETKEELSGESHELLKDS